MSTKERLAKVLMDAGLVKMSARALEGAYDDFESDSATPITDLVCDLRRAGRQDLAQRAMDGDFDATAEESEAWFKEGG